MILDHLDLDPSLVDDHAREALGKCSDTDIKAVLVVLEDLRAIDPTIRLDFGETIDEVRRLHPRRREKLAARVDERGHVYDGQAPVPPVIVDDDNEYARLLAEDERRAEAAALPAAINARAFALVAEHRLGWEDARRRAAAELAPRT